jgi:DNA-directed RNA polymerase specialized sigma24 family protein
VTADALLEVLPADQRSALRARVLDERPYGEIAMAEGASEAAVRQRVSRGLSSLRQRIGGKR